ncbi:hypothetical protein BOH72_01750 [Mycobacterium sp. WY10]|nr:hypothetical protein BOH72_01750 [Mycobacterium sp. WY10]
MVLALQDRKLKQDAERLRRDVDRDMTAGFGNIGDHAGAAFGNNFQKATEQRVRKAANAFAEATDVAALKQSTLNERLTKYSAVAKRAADAESQLARMRQQANRDLDAEARQVEKLTKLRVTEANLTKQVTKAHLDLNRARRSVGDRQSSLDSLIPKIDTTDSVNQVGRLGTALANLGDKVSPLGAFGTVGIVAAVAALVDVSTVAASAAKSILLLPAAGAAAGAAFGTLALATMGFDDALKNIRDPQKFNESLLGLAPNAREAAQSLRQLVPVFDGLQRNTQNTFFAGIGQELNQIADQFAPTIQRLTTGVAGAMNTALHGVGEALMAPGVQQNIDVLVTNIIGAFRNLTPAVQPVVQAIAQLASAGSGALPQIATGIANAAKAFGEWVDVNSKNGNISKWLDEGLNTIQQLIPLASSLAQNFMTLAPIGEKILPDIVKVFDQVGQILPEIAAASLVLGPDFAAVGLAAHQVETAVTLIGTAFSTVEGVVVSVVNRIIPVVNSVGQSISNALGPINTMIDAANALGAGIPNIPEWTGIPQIPTGDQQVYGGANAQRERRGAAPVPLPTAGIPGLLTTPVPGTLGGSVLTPRATGPSWSSSGGLFTVPASSGGGGGGSPSSSLPSGDAAILSRVPSGRYLQTQAADLTKGIGDCSSAVEDLINLMDGVSTAGRGMSTGNAAQWLTAHGFVQGMGGPGDFRVGFNSQHMQATLPGGTPFNWGSADAAARRGIGGTGADDPSFTSHFYRPGGATGARVTPVRIEDISSRAATDMQQQIGQKIDDDFGVSKGLPGIFENLTKMLANLAMAPVLGALSGVTSAFGSAGPGSGLLGALAPRQNAFGQQMPDALGRISSGGGSSSGGSSSGGLLQNLFGGGSTPQAGSSAYGAANGPQSASPGLGTLGGNAGPAYNTGSPWQMANTTGTRSTASRGIPLGQGLPQSSGIGFGKGGLTGLIGSAATSAAGAAGLMAGGMDGGAGGALASAAAQIGIDELNRAIGFGAQAAGIGVQGLMETFLPVESQLADPTRGWLGRVIGGIAGIRPVADITAGAMTKSDKANTADSKDGPLTADQVDKRDKERGIGAGATSNTTNNVNVNAELHGEPDANAKALANAAWAQNAPSGPSR